LADVGEANSEIGFDVKVGGIKSRVGEPIEGDGLVKGDGLAVEAGNFETRIGAGLGDSFWQAAINIGKSSSHSQTPGLFFNQFAEILAMLLTSNLMHLFYGR
jgi:hypothetical protein